MHELFHTVGVPLLIGLGLSFLKLIAEQRDITPEETNSIALDLILVSIGALCGFYYKNRSVDAISGAVAGDFILAVALLGIRAKRTRDRAKLIAEQREITPVSSIVGVFELIMGVFSIYWTIKAP